MKSETRKENANPMYGLRKMLLKERERLQKIEEKTREQLKNAPEGQLRISKTNHHIQYYLCTEGCPRKNGVYLHKTEKELAYQLAQKRYDEKVLHLVNKRLKQIEKLAKDYPDDEIERIFLNEHEERQRLICPIEFTWDQQLEQWWRKEYEGKGFKEGDPLIYSEKGERVRSKSEKILADYFYHNHIPYKYEKPLLLAGYGVVYPDFTFLSKRTGKEIYWEHEGRMDDPGYVKSAIKKMESYENNGIFIGERLILTFETETVVLSSKSIARNVERFLM